MFPWALNYDNTGVTVTLGELVAAGVNPWAFDYPSYYKDAEKTAFEKKVIDHYRFRQIGQETPARFLHYFRSRVNEIMPYYIQLYKSVELLEAQGDPLESYHLEETYTRMASSESESSGSGTSNTTTAESGTEAETTEANTTVKESDTPQGEVSNLHDGYLTKHTNEQTDGTKSATRTVDGTEGVTSSTEGNASSTDTETHTLTRRGNIGVQPLGYEINELRKAFLNIDMQIIGELNDLFLMVY